MLNIDSLEMVLHLIKAYGIEEVVSITYNTGRKRPIDIHLHYEDFCKLSAAGGYAHSRRDRGYTHISFRPARFPLVEFTACHCFDESARGAA